MSDLAASPVVKPTSPTPLVTAISVGPRHELAEALNKALQDALAMHGKLPPEVFGIQGFSGRKMRIFFNNIMRYVGKARYLEIGLFHGASFCPALYQNPIRAVGIDNWSEFAGSRATFEKSLNAFKSQDADVTIIERNFRDVDYTSIGKFNIVFYDGSHKEQDQYDGVKYPMDAMDDTFILLVDDWNWDDVRSGTYRALTDANARIDYSMEIRTTFNGGFPSVNGAGSDWHNGLFGAVITKSAGETSDRGAATPEGASGILGRLRMLRSTLASPPSRRRGQ